MRNTIVLTLALVGVGAASAQEGPDLGVPATQEQIAGWDISIGPDGAGLPAGSGTAAAGKAVYEAKCLACHGAEGAGQPNDRLVGGQGTLREAAPILARAAQSYRDALCGTVPAAV